MKSSVRMQAMALPMVIRRRVLGFIFHLQFGG
jgi:hypothetical protein